MIPRRIMMVLMLNFCSGIGVIGASANNTTVDGDDTILWTMTAILVTMMAVVVGIVSIQIPFETSKSSSSFLPNRLMEPSKYSYEVFVGIYTPIWIIVFGIIIVFQLYEQFTASIYIYVCGGLALPLLVQPIIVPSGYTNSPDQYRPLLQRYSFKANVWIAIYSFIGNYWYTHYFYSVLKASYTMDSYRLNNVPIQMFCATHFYFTTYHWFSNCLLRKICTTYVPTIQRQVLCGTTIVVFSYFTAFMETLTISSYPYYTFENKFMAYTVGSAFYGIYFLISFPAFYYFDTGIDTHHNKDTNGTTTTTTTTTTTVAPMTLWDTIVSSCGYGMIILFLLDFVRLYLDIPLIVGTSTYQCTAGS